MPRDFLSCLATLTNEEDGVIGRYIRYHIIFNSAEGVYVRNNTISLTSGLMDTESFLLACELTPLYLKEQLFYFYGVSHYAATGISSSSQVFLTDV